MRVVHCKSDPYTHYIGRPSPLGNPFVIGQAKTRKIVIAEYKDYAMNNKQVRSMIYSLPEDAVLGCWCSPKECHGGVIIEIWNELHKE